MKSAIQKLGQQPQDYEITEIENNIKRQKEEEIREYYKEQIDQSKLKKDIAQIDKMPIHITYDMFLQIMTVRLRVTLTDADLKKAF